MADRERRKELMASYRQRKTEAGVYRIVNRTNGKSLLGSTTDLASMGNKMAFAQTTGMPGALGLELRDDARAHGIGAFALEILEVLDVTPEMKAQAIRSDLATLEALWREKYDPALLY